MTFNDINGETGSGGAWGGLEGYNGATYRLIFGNSWISTNWSFGGTAAFSEVDLQPPVPVVVGEWHTWVLKIQFTPYVQATVTAWLDPDFGLPESSQPATTPKVAGISTDMTFDTIRLRCGNATASASFSNIVFAATPEAVGFASSVLIPPEVGGFGYGANGFYLTATGPNGQAYRILSSTNVALPVADWTVDASGTFGPSGVVSFTNGASGDTRRFFRVRSP